MLDSLICMSLGFVLCVSANSFISSLVFIAVAKALNYKLLYIKYLFFEFSRINDKNKLHIGKFSAISQHNMFKSDSTKKDDYKNIFISLTLTTLIDLIFILISVLKIVNMYQNPGNIAVRSFLEGAVFYLVFNMIQKWFMSIRFVTSEEEHLITYTKKVSKQWIAGTPIEEISLPPYKELGLLAMDSEIISYSILRFMQKVWMNQWDELEEIVHDCEKILNKDSNQFGYIKAYTNAYYNLIFYYSYVKKYEEKARHFYQIVSRDLEKDADANGRRVLAYYEYFVNHDVKKARLRIAEGRRSLPKFSSVLTEQDYENKLLEHLDNIINFAEV